MRKPKLNPDEIILRLSPPSVDAILTALFDAPSTMRINAPVFQEIQRQRAEFFDRLGVK